jgi:hypothetical protein
MLKISAVVFIAILAELAFADNSSLNLQLPNAGNSYGTDKIRAGDFECSAAIGGATNFEIGATGIVNNAVSPFGSEDVDNPTTKDIGLYARIVIPLDAPRERVNCNTLYQLELERRRLEVMKLQQELENLKKLQGGFEN